MLVEEKERANVAIVVGVGGGRNWGSSAKPGASTCHVWEISKERSDTTRVDSRSREIGTVIQVGIYEDNTTGRHCNYVERRVLCKFHTRRPKKYAGVYLVCRYNGFNFHLVGMQPDEVWGGVP